MNRNPRAIIAAPRTLTWRSRLPFILGLVAVAIGILLFSVDWVGGSAIYSWLIVATLLVCGVVVATLGTLMINPTGVFVEGLAPPFKAPGALLQEPFVI